jgi:FMN reductase
MTRSLVVVAAGVSQPSSTRLLADRLAAAVVGALADRGEQAQVRVIEVRELAHDVVNATLTGVASPALADAHAAVEGADGLVVVAPVFTAGPAGLAKAFVDTLDPERLVGTPVLLGATGGTPRHSLVPEYAMRPWFAYLHADVVPTSVYAATDDWATEGGDGVAPLPERIRRAGRELADRIAARPATARPGLYDDVPSFDQLLGGAGRP